MKNAAEHSLLTDWNISTFLFITTVGSGFTQVVHQCVREQRMIHEIDSHGEEADKGLVRALGLREFVKIAILAQS